MSTTTHLRIFLVECLVSLCYAQMEQPYGEGDYYQRMSTSSKLQTTLRNATVQSKVACAVWCSHNSDCESISYEQQTRTCELSAIEGSVAINVDSATQNGWTIYTKQFDWTLVFRGTPGNGVDVYEAWFNNANVTSTDVTCQQLNATTCTKHYRHTMLDSWGSLPISKIKYSLYKDGAEAAYVTFNATGSTNTNWFTKDRILNSSWTDITEQSFNHFSLAGDIPRRFFINLNYGGCSNDNGYTVTLTRAGHGCAYDSQASYPQFVYANSTTNVKTDSADFVLADAMAIHVL